jgi:hypothetical protein
MALSGVREIRDRMRVEHYQDKNIQMSIQKNNESPGAPSPLIN